MTYTMTIRGRKPIACRTLAEASDTYSRLRDESGRGASSWPPATLVGPDGAAFTISYNGRVWRGDGSDVSPAALVHDPA